jgi:hypothetical protein
MKEEKITMTRGREGALSNNAELRGREMIAEELRKNFAFPF